MSRIVITGATGFVGKPLVEKLLSEGHEITALVRDVAQARSRLPAQVNVVEWSVEAGLPPHPSIFEKVDIVYNLMGEPIAGARWTQPRKRAIYESRVTGTKLLVKALEACATKPQVLVSTSAVGYYGDRGDEELDESSAGARDFLAEVCADWEAAAMSAEKLGLRVVCLRLGVVLGKGGGALKQMLPPFRLGVGGRLGDGQQWMSWIHLHDVVTLFAEAAHHPNWRGPVDAVSPEPVRNADFTKALGHALHRPTIFPVPKVALKLLMGDMSQILLDSQRCRPKKAQADGFTFTYPKLDEALKDLVLT